MKLDDLFNTGPKPLFKAPAAGVQTAGPSNKGKESATPTVLPGTQENIQAGTPAAVIFKAPMAKPGPIPVTWPKMPSQEPKDYQVITTVDQLKAYIKRCEQTGLGSFDYETAADDTTRSRYMALGDEQKEAVYKDYKASPLDPWRAEICTLSLSAAAHEARVVFISHKKGSKNFEPGLSREEARKLVMDTLEKHFFTNPRIMKIAVNIAFETKFTAKYGKYILMPCADPLVAWVRTLQVTAPHKIVDPKAPYAGKGLKPMTKEYFGVVMDNFTETLAKHGADFFDEISTDEPDAVSYSAEDSDYGLQQYLYWREVWQQIPKYDSWLHNYEMPFGRVIGLMEYWGMRWDSQAADQKLEEAEIMQEQASLNIKRIVQEATGQAVNPGKTGKTKDVKYILFDVMKVPAAKWGKTGPSLDEEALLDMTFMLENKLVSLDEEKYLGVPLPEGWEYMDVDTCDLNLFGEATLNEWQTEADRVADLQRLEEIKKRTGRLDKEQRARIRIAQRQPHPYTGPAIALMAEMQKIQSYTTLVSSHIVGRAKYVNEVSGHIHAQYGPWTETARLSSSKPNGQNVPRPDNDAFKIRNFFIPRDNSVLFFIDFSGFELRLMAWAAKDAVMIDIFNNGGDMHRRTAATLTGKPESEITKVERTNAKAGNFGISYGGTEHALQKTFKTDYGIRKSLDECLAVVNAVKNTYTGIPVFQREIALEAREKGYVDTMYGYIRLLPNINSANTSYRRQDERRAANTPIQGSAADVMKRSQNLVYDKIGLDTAAANGLTDLQLWNGYSQTFAAMLAEEKVMEHGKTDMIAQIHDEIIFNMADDKALVAKAGNWVKRAMEVPPIEGFPVPIEAEASIGWRWGEKKALESYIEGAV